MQSLIPCIHQSVRSYSILPIDACPVKKSAVVRVGSGVLLELAVISTSSCGQLEYRDLPIE
jgi:hypothetical protein